MDHLSRLARTDKNTLVGNLIRSISPGAGLGGVGWGEQIISREAMNIYVLANSHLTPFSLQHLTWRPDGIEATHRLGSLELSEVKFVYDDTLVDEITFRNTGPEAVAARVVVLTFLEGRKACGHCVSVPGMERAWACLVDMGVSRHLQAAFGSSRPADALRWAPFQPTLLRCLTEPGASGIQSTFKQDSLNCGMVFDLHLEAGASSSWTLAFTVATTPQDALSRLGRPLADRLSCRARTISTWQAFFDDQVPHFECSWPELADLYYYAWHVQHANRIEIASERLPWAFGVPAKFKYPHLWFWDACLQAIALRWLADPSYCFGNLRSVARQQYPDGMIPHETYLWPGTASSNWPDGNGQSSSVTQPPVFAEAVWEAYCVTGDQQILVDLFPSLARYDQWYDDCRDPDRDHLYTWVHRWETGWDTSPRWDGGFDVEPVDLNALLVIQREVLARCAELLGQPKQARAYRQRARQVADALRRQAWEAQSGFFFDLDESDTPTRVRTAAPFLTLIAGVPTREQAAALVRNLTNPATFWPAYPVPTVPQDDPEFEPANYWRGPTWIHLNRWIIKGLLRYGYRAEATELARRTFRLMLSTGRPTCNECYNPLTGAEARTADLSWSGLVADLIITTIGGIVPRPDGQLECDPLDFGLDAFVLDNVPYHGHRIRLAYDRTGGYRVAADGKVLARRAEIGPVGRVSIP